MGVRRALAGGALGNLGKVFRRGGGGAAHAAPLRVPRHAAPARPRVRMPAGRSSGAHSAPTYVPRHAAGGSTAARASRLSPQYLDRGDPGLQAMFDRSRRPMPPRAPRSMPPPTGRPSEAPGGPGRMRRGANWARKNPMVIGGAGLGLGYRAGKSNTGSGVTTSNTTGMYGY